MKRGKGLGLFVIFLLCIMLGACSGNLNLDRTARNMEKSNERELQPKEHFKLEQEITLSAIGDMLIHAPVYRDAKTDNGYDFTPMLERVKPFLSNATITVANQETMIGGEELGLSTYPSFNSPFEVGDALKEAGVDVVTIANNHTLDRGEEAIQRAINHWETIDIMYTGAYKDEVDRDNVRIYKTEEGISVAFLSYTYGTNGIPVPQGKDYLVNLIDRNRLATDIAEVKDQADVISLSLHFGNEYERMPNDAQKELVQFAADHGVHIVIGHHPHVLQPTDWVTGKDGNKTFVIYSLGNFLSSQQGLYRQIGGIVNVTISKTVEGGEKTIEIKEPRFIPTFVKYHNWSNYEVIPMYQLTSQDLAGAAAYYQEIKDHMSQWMPELEFIEK